VDLCITNALAMYRLSSPTLRTATGLDFRLDLIDELLADSGFAIAPKPVAASLPRPSPTRDVQANDELDAVYEKAKLRAKAVEMWRPSITTKRPREAASAFPPPSERHSSHLPIPIPAEASYACDMPGCGAKRASVVCTCGIRLCLSVKRNCYGRFHDLSSPPLVRPPQNNY
jgi:hypothetical protein